ncbi:MAG: DAK2 domain-containing protein [Cellulomonadaceae bacterium]|jgi:hypothetical protein|nr:DAK2 domain-containing protein [Cellulomonadaceae bacterium]
MVPDVLPDASVIRAWARLAAGALGRDRELIDSINVFPVPDADTGTNMYLTMRNGAKAVGAMDDSVTDSARLLRALARGALLGARGNSGVILSEWLRGLAAGASRGEELATALVDAAQSARHAVVEPAPGTILTAADAAGAAATEASSQPGATMPSVLNAAVQGARAAALESVTALGALTRAGFLDAGACGLVLVLDAMRAAPAIAHHAPAESSSAHTSTLLVVEPVSLGIDLTGYAPGGEDHVDFNGASHGESDDDAYEVMFVLHRPGDATGFEPGGVGKQLRADLAAIGDSVVVVGGSAFSQSEESTWQAHVHSEDLSAALAVAERWAANVARAGGRAEPAIIKHLAVPDSELAVITVATTPSFARDLAPAVSAVLYPLGGGQVGPTDLANAAVGTGARQALVLIPGDEHVAEAIRNAIDLQAEAVGSTDGIGTPPQVNVRTVASEAALVNAIVDLLVDDS